MSRKKKCEEEPMAKKSEEVRIRLNRKAYDVLVAIPAYPEQIGIAELNRKMGLPAGYVMRYSALAPLCEDGTPRNESVCFLSQALKDEYLARVDVR